MIKGNDIIIIQGGTAIACAKSCEIEVDADLQEVSNASTGAWHSYITKRKGWDINVSTLVTSVKDSISLVGTKVELHIGKVTDGSRTLSEDKMKGYAIITKWKCTSTRGNLAKGTFSFKGTGALTEGE